MLFRIVWLKKARVNQHSPRPFPERNAQRCLLTYFLPSCHPRKWRRIEPMKRNLLPLLGPSYISCVLDVTEKLTKLVHQTKREGSIYISWIVCFVKEKASWSHKWRMEPALRSGISGPLELHGQELFWRSPMALGMGPDAHGRKNSGEGLTQGWMNGWAMSIMNMWKSIWYFQRGLKRVKDLILLSTFFNRIRTFLFFALLMSRIRNQLMYPCLGAKLPLNRFPSFLSFYVVPPFFLSSWSNHTIQCPIFTPTP